MKYTVELCGRMRGIQILNLTVEERDELLEEEDLNEVFLDWVDKKDYDFELEGHFLNSGVDRTELEIKDESGESVFYSDDPTGLPDRTYDAEDEDDLYIPGYAFGGILDGDYLVRSNVTTGCFYQGVFDLDDEFDESRLYMIRDSRLNSDFDGNDFFSAEEIYYMRGEKPDLEKDRIILEYVSDSGEQYWDTWLMNNDMDEWTNLQELD